MMKEEAIRKIQEHNDSIDTYINSTLAQELGAKDGKISMNQWFKAQSLIKEQNFYEKGMSILQELRSAGFDVKMNMQSNKLVGLGVYN